MVGELVPFGAAIEVGFLWLAVVEIADGVLSLGLYLGVVVPSTNGLRRGRIRRRCGPGPGSAPPLLTLWIGVAARTILGRLG